METAVRFGHPILIRISRLPSNPPIQICWLPAIRDLSLKRFQVSSFFFNSQSYMSTHNSPPPQSTADNMNNKQSREQEKEKKLPPPPPPPEKPEPGDCCGSGCVRCVWDVYYEELEAYNNLYKSDSDLSDSKL